MVKELIELLNFNELEEDMKATDCEIVEIFHSFIHTTNKFIPISLEENRTAAEKPTPVIKETIDMLEPTPDMNGNISAKVTQPLLP
jgi:hypothetical protein